MADLRIGWRRNASSPDSNDAVRDVLAWTGVSGAPWGRLNVSGGTDGKGHEFRGSGESWIRFSWENSIGRCELGALMNLEDTLVPGDLVDCDRSMLESVAAIPGGEQHPHPARRQTASRYSKSLRPPARL